MSDESPESRRKEVLKQALVKIDQLQHALADVQSRSSEPIAIIGMACRFPGGADTPERFWELLRDGVDAVTEIPAERWNLDDVYSANRDAPGATYARGGAFLRDVDRFDPQFFGIAPIEAASMDPQQRLLLEVGWEAIERSGQNPARLNQRAVGVFLGLTTSDYAQLIGGAVDPANYDAYFGTGTARSVASGRLSYVLGLHGPSITVDTACSSSLVAVHLACQSLRTGESALALAGAANLVLLPDGHIVASRAQMLSADGRCKTFDAAADGYGRGEGCAMIVLKRLSDALADRDQIAAVICGTACNQDGRSGGLTAPSGHAQEAVVRAAALANSSCDPGDVAYVETHGTGTLLGDPIELQALAAVFADRDPQAPLLIGSVKTNIAHLEAAAGIAGLMKVVLAIQHGEIPPHLHFHAPNPHIPWDELPLRVASARTPWPGGARRISGISSFGFSGTNVHIICEAPPAIAPAGSPSQASTPPARGIRLLPLSAKTPEALQAVAERFLAALTSLTQARSQDAFEDFIYTAQVGRSHFRCRLAILAASAGEMLQRLQDYCRGERPSGVFDRLPETAPLAGGYQDLSIDLHDFDPASPDWPERVGQLAERYVAGESIDWDQLSAGQRRRSAILPTYPFQRERYWTAGAAVPSKDQRAHPLLGRRLRSPRLSEAVFAAELTTRSLPFAGDHRVHGHAIMPATAFLELAALAASEEGGDAEAWDVLDLQIHQPLFVPDKRPCLLQSIVGRHAGQFNVEMHALADESGADHCEWRLVAQSRVEARSNRAQPRLAEQQIAAWRNECDQSIDPSELYRLLEERGAAYGPAFRGIRGLRFARHAVLSELELPASLEAESVHYRLHPALLDAALQSLAAGLLADDDGSLFTPIEVKRYEYFNRPAGVVSCYGRIDRPAAAGGRLLDCELTLFDEAGWIVARLRGVRFHRTEQLEIDRWTRQDGRRWLHVVEWRELDASTTAQQRELSHERWLIFADRGNLAQALAERVASSGGQALLVPCQDSKLASDNGHAATPFGFRPTRVVDLGAIDSAAESAKGLVADRTWGCGELLTRLQSGFKASNGAAGLPPQWTLVTRGVEPAGKASQRSIAGAMGGAAVRGLGRVLATEHPELKLCLVDLPVESTAQADAQWLWQSIVGPGLNERELSVRGGRLCAARLTSYDGAKATRAAEAWPVLAAPQGRPYQLIVTERGVLDRFALAPTDVAPPATGEVQLEVLASGLNFRDVLCALDLYPGGAGDLGSECVGRVTNVGAGVTTAGPGDLVMAITPRAFCSRVNTPAALVFPVPAGLTVEQAATIPIAFLTAWYALHHIGQMKRGERVLIHAAAGGVGMAALQLARLAGLEIYATAGSDEKRVLVRRHGAHIVMSSRSTDFAAEVQRATHGEGVDLVLNSLTGDFIPAGLSVLRRGGRFLELGKIELWDQDQVERTRPGVKYHAVQLGDVCTGDAPLIQQMYTEVAGLLNRGKLQPLPVQRFAITAADDAFRIMAQARHVGKIVITAETTSQSQLVAPNRTYLITGGLGGVGLEVARWLVELGASRIVLAGRRAPSGDAIAAISAMQRPGVQIETIQADIADRASAARVIALCNLPSAPLGGIVHAAGVLRDGLLAAQTAEQFAEVLGPKVTGAWHLHELTANMPIDFFWLFSAGAALLGAPGQANYAAANAALDALALHRHAAGLPALSINWGPWAESGMAARMDRRTQAAWAAQGIKLMPPRTALAALDLAARSGRPQVAVLPIDWQRFLGAIPAGDEPPLLRELLQTAPIAPAAPIVPPDDGFLVRLGAADAEDRIPMMYDFLGGEVRRVLGLDARASIRPDQGLTDLGMDSLMAVQLANRLKQSLGVALPTTLAFEHPTLEALARHLLSKLSLAPAPPGVVSGAAKHAPALSAPRNLGQDEIDALERQLADELRSAGF